jgi:hypothetical protein
MVNPDIKKAIGILRGKTLFPGILREAQQLIISSGHRVNDVQVAIYFSEQGDTKNARLAAGRAADTLSRMF